MKAWNILDMLFYDISLCGQQLHYISLLLFFWIRKSMNVNSQCMHLLFGIYKVHQKHLYFMCQLGWYYISPDLQVPFIKDNTYYNKNVTKVTFSFNSSVTNLFVLWSFLLVFWLFLPSTLCHWAMDPHLHYAWMAR